MSKSTIFMIAISKQFVAPWSKQLVIAYSITNGFKLQM
jgi:hypothetical protein